MYARANIIFAAADRIEDGIAYLEGADRAAVEATVGNRGLTTLVDRDNSVIVAMSYWDLPGHSSEAPLTRARRSATVAAGGDLIVESYEVAATATHGAAGPGPVVRMARTHLDPGRIEQGLGFLRGQVLPRIQVGPGFCSAEVLIDSLTGDGMVVTGWTDADSAVQSETVFDDLRDEAAEQVGAKFPGSETYALVNTSVPPAS